MDAQQISSALDAIGALLEKTLVKPYEKNVFSKDECIEIIDRSNQLTKRFGISVSNARWSTLIDMMCFMTSKRETRSQKALKGAAILNNMTFFLDDLSNDLVKDGALEVVMDEIGKAVREYYLPGDVDRVIAAARQWATLDTIFRDSPTQKLLARNSYVYWQARTIESGTHYFLVATSPVYQNPKFSQLVDLMIPAQQAVKPTMLVNDLVSTYREKVYKEDYNYFLNFAGDMNRDMEDVKHNLEVIKSLGDDVSDIVLQKIYGNYLWARSSPRYRNEITDINCKLGASGRATA